MKCNRHNFLSFRPVFCPFTPPPPMDPENQNFEKMKKCLEILSFYKSATKIMIICYIVPEIWCMMDVIAIFHFGLFYALLPPNSPKHENFKKMKKRPGHIIILHKCTKNHYHMVYVPGIWCMMDVIAIFHFGLFFTLCLTRLKNENFK